MTRAPDQCLSPELKSLALDSQDPGPSQPPARQLPQYCLRQFGTEPIRLDDITAFRGAGLGHGLYMARAWRGHVLYKGGLEMHRKWLVSAPFGCLCPGPQSVRLILLGISVG